MATISIVCFFVILVVVNSEIYGDGKALVDGETIDLKEFVARQNQLNAMLLDKVDVLTEQLGQRNDDVATLRAEFKQLQEVCMDAQGPNKRLLLMNQPQPQYEHHTTAFTARHGSHHVTGLGNQQPIVFDDVLTNVGNGYSPLTGVFTATTNGTFFFFVSILSFHDDYIEAEIVKNGVNVVYTYAKGVNTQDQGSNAAALVLTEGDKVWVRHRGQYGTRVIGYGWSSFTGFQF